MKIKKIKNGMGSDYKILTLPLGVVALAQVTVDTSHGELKTGPGIQGKEHHRSLHRYWNNKQGSDF